MQVKTINPFLWGSYFMVKALPVTWCAGDNLVLGKPCGRRGLDEDGPLLQHQVRVVLQVLQQSVSLQLGLIQELVFLHVLNVYQGCVHIEFNIYAHTQINIQQHCVLICLRLKGFRIVWLRIHLWNLNLSPATTTILQPHQPFIQTCQQQNKLLSKQFKTYQKGNENIVYITSKSP